MIIVAAEILANFVGQPICFVHSFCYFCPIIIFQVVYCGVTLFTLIFLIISHTFFAGVSTFSFDTYSCHDFVLFSLITLRALDRQFLYSCMSDKGFVWQLSIAF